MKGIPTEGIPIKGFLVVVEILAPIPEESPGTAMGLQEVEIKRMNEHAFLVSTEGLHKIPTMVGDE